MLPDLKRAVVRRLEVVWEVGGLALSLSGATLAAVLGKLLAAVVLGTLALGFFLRITGRRGGRQAAPVVPRWVRPMAAMLSVVEVAALVEATNLPVRFSQPGFAIQHWLVVLGAFVAAYMLQVQGLRSLFRRAPGSG